VNADISQSFRNVPVMVENIDDGTCLFADKSLVPYPFEMNCDYQDVNQHFIFVVTAVPLTCK
jgi:hypothetical protein